MGSEYKSQGSEKISNVDEKLKRIKVIAGISNKPTLQENNHNTKFSTVLHSATAADGQTYGLVQEGSKVYIKCLIGENYEYLNGDERHHSYKDYAQAFKHLNMIFKDISQVHEHSEPINLFEGGLKEKKNLIKERYVLKTPESNVLDVQPSPVDMSPQDAALEPQPDESSEELNQELDTAEQGLDDQDPIKAMQKMVGKLTQQMRTAEDHVMSSEFQKSILNSVISAIRLEKMEDADLLSIVKKLKGDENPETAGEPTSEFMNDEGIDYNPQVKTNETKESLMEDGRDGTPTWDDQVMPDIVQQVVSNVGYEVNQSNENDVVQAVDYFLKTYSTDQNQTDYMKQLANFVSKYSTTETINTDRYTDLSPMGQEIYDSLETLDPNMGQLENPADSQENVFQNQQLFKTSMSNSPAMAAESTERLGELITEALKEK